MNDPRKRSFVGRSIPRREDHRLLTGSQARLRSHARVGG
jgi:hypothetical protein